MLWINLFQCLLYFSHCEELKFKIGFFVGFSYGLNAAVVTAVLFREIIYVVSAHT